MKAHKLFKKVLAGSKNIRFDDFVTLIIAFGFTLERITGSHRVFSHPNIPQTISAQPNPTGQAKPYQIRQFLRLVEKYELSLLDEQSDDEEQQ